MLESCFPPPIQCFPAHPGATNRCRSRSCCDRWRRIMRAVDVTPTHGRLYRKRRRVHWILTEPHCSNRQLRALDRGDARRREADISALAIQRASVFFGRTTGRSCQPRYPWRQQIPFAPSIAAVSPPLAIASWVSRMAAGFLSLTSCARIGVQRFASDHNSSTVEINPIAAAADNVW